jgi:hypothetical protein
MDLRTKEGKEMSIVEFNGRKYATVLDYASYKGITTQAVYTRIKRKGLRSIKLGGVTLIELITTYV